MKAIIATVLILVLLAAHQDFWNWSNRGLVFGFLPVGLAYHAGYSIAAACAMALLVKFFWPAELEAADTEEPSAHTDTVADKAGLEEARP